MFRSSAAQQRGRIEAWEDRDKQVVRKLARRRKARNKRIFKWVTK